MTTAKDTATGAIIADVNPDPVRGLFKRLEDGRAAELVERFELSDAAPRVFEDVRAAVWRTRKGPGRGVRELPRGRCRPGGRVPRRRRQADPRRARGVA